MARQRAQSKKRKQPATGPCKLGAFDGLGYKKWVELVHRPAGRKKPQLAEAWEVDFIFGARRVNGRFWEFAVKWTGWPWSYFSWEPQKSFSSESGFKTTSWDDYTFITNSKGQPAYENPSTQAKEVPAISSFERLLKDEHEDFAQLRMKEHLDGYEIMLSLRTVARLWMRNEHSSKEEFLSDTENLREMYWPNVHNLGTESEDEAMDLYQPLSGDSDREDQDAGRFSAPPQSPAAPRSPRTSEMRSPTPQMRLPSPETRLPTPPIQPKTPPRKPQTAPRRRRVPPQHIPSDSEDERASPPKAPRPIRLTPPPVEAGNVLEAAITTKNRLARGYDQTSPRKSYVSGTARPHSLLTAVSKHGLVTMRPDGRVESVQTWSSTPTKVPVVSQRVEHDQHQWRAPSAGLDDDLLMVQQRLPGPANPDFDSLVLQMTGSRGADSSLKSIIPEVEPGITLLPDSPLASPVGSRFSAATQPLPISKPFLQSQVNTSPRLLSSSQPTLAPTHSILRLVTDAIIPLSFTELWADVVNESLSWKLEARPSPAVYIDVARGRRVPSNDFKRHLEEGRWTVASCSRVERLRSGPREQEHIVIFRHWTNTLISTFMFVQLSGKENDGLIMFAAKNADLHEALKEKSAVLDRKMKLESPRGNLLVAHVFR